MRHTVPVKSLDHAMVFLYLNFFSTWQINIEDMTNYEGTHMELCGKQKKC